MLIVRSTWTGNSPCVLLTQNQGSFIMTGENMEYHEYANLFPMMNSEEIKQLCEDMRARGYDQTAPIVLCGGKILDGRNRQLAADTVGVKPNYIEFTGDDPLAFVIGHNLHRRHLNETQRAGVAAKLANLPGHRPGNKSPNLDTYSVSIPQAAMMMNVGKSTVSTYRAVVSARPDLAEKMDNGEMTAYEAHKEILKIQRTDMRKAIAEVGASIPTSDKWHIYQGDIETWQAPRQYDFLITDPPYPKEFLRLYEVLAIRANEWLKDGGLLIAMCGQSYLDEIYSMMSKHLKYYWTASYLTPGQPTPLRQINVNTTWKPLLIYSKGKYTGKIFGDVFKSDGNNKDFHKWGQSESGMYDLISKICLPGQYILDPFCGAGTTGIAALRHGCLFDGLDLLEENVNISKGRLNDKAA